jgi:quercetin dioxygenase-like cupin family protein
VEIRRFGIGHRRDEGPAGTHGVEGRPIHADERGAIAELAFRPNAAIAPHSNPNLTYFLVIEGGGFVQVGEERARVAAGDAVVLPPGVIHAAWTELTPMRAIVVEFGAESRDAAGRALLPEGEPSGSEEPEPAAGGSTRASLKGEGSLVPKPAVMPPDRESPENEPW